MNTKKGFSTILLVAFALLATLALRPVFADVGESGTEDEAAIAQHVGDMRYIMHYAAVVPTAIDSGVKVAVTGQDPELVAAIKREFAGERHEPEAPFAGVTVSTEALDNGVAVTYTASDADTIKQLQAYGAQLVYNELRNNMHEIMVSYGGGRGFYGGMHRFGGMGPGWMHGPGFRGGPGTGYGPQDGRGPGWMHGPGYRGGPGGGGQGFGPGSGPSN